jgi:hypothetical protein
VIYREIALSPQEMEARRTHVLTMLDAGLMDQVEALRYFGSLSEQDAVAKLAQIKAMRAEAPPSTVTEGATPGATAPNDSVSEVTQ